MATFREMAAEFFIDALGEPHEIRVEAGVIYRWVIRRPGNLDVAIYVTLDSPELANYAHLLVSDPACGGNDPVQDVMMRTEADFGPALELIRRHTDCR
jgi:hypothetical protein